MILFFSILLTWAHSLCTIESTDRWLVELKPNQALCLESWWTKNGFDSNQYQLKFLPIENWVVIEIPVHYSKSLKQLPCIQSMMVDALLENWNTIPDDPQFSLQNDMDLIGLPAAWDLSTGGLTVRGDTIVVAVIDDGYQLDHEDLVENLWHNFGEIPNDGIDNDNNGYVDDYTGVNITTGNDMHPVLHHGTSVSGIIGAKGDNGKGTCGVNWNVKLMLISHNYHVSALAEAYQYVVDMRKKYNESNGKEGAFVVAVNLSSGIPYGWAENFPIWCSMYDKLGAQGILGVCSTSNNDNNADASGDLPARCTSPFTIIVTNVGPDDEKMENAGYGRISVDLGAPGENSLTTDISNTYTYFTGTSAAAPHVAGTVALLYSHACTSFFDSLHTNPGLIATRIKKIILNSGTPNTSLENITLSGKRLQTDAALQALMNECVDDDQTKALIRFIAPNPTKNGVIKLFFEAPDESTDIFVEVYSIIGVKVRRSVISKEEYRQGFLTINTSTLPVGLYIISLHSGSQFDSTKLVVK